MKKINLFIFCVIFILIGINFYGQDKKVVTFWFGGDDSVYDKYFKNAALEFNKLNPNIEVRATALPPLNLDMDIKLNAAKFRANILMFLPLTLLPYQVEEQKVNSQIYQLL